MKSKITRVLMFAFTFTCIHACTFVESDRVAMPQMAFKMQAAAPTPTEFNTEQYDYIDENTFRKVRQYPLSTFSIDVDTASYANVRRFLNDRRLPPVDAVRVEELINYFSYDYPEPTGDEPFSLSVEASSCPWNNRHQLVHIGIKGKSLKKEKQPPSNLVFLLDVSGSMNAPSKLPLLKKAFRLLVRQLDADDRVSVVVYAGAAGLVLPPTPGSENKTIVRALDNLRAGGSTAGAAGIHLAYQVAKDNYLNNGNNRVILATDGDFNVGTSSDSELVRLIEAKRKEGIFLTVLGFGMGNLKDAKMEKLSNKGNGQYAYIDNLLEAKKVLVKEIGATLFTIAKDVKIQVEFNPARIDAYRLVGYENRLLKQEDFQDDKKDAGELGAGHTVTALYEIIPAGKGTQKSDKGQLKYQSTRIKPSALSTDEIMTVKLRFKKPKADKSRLMVFPVIANYLPQGKTSDNFRFSAAVAQFGMLLRNSKFKGTSSYRESIQLAKDARGRDEEGYRAEFIRLIELAEMLDERRKDQ
jgi:Ca-activated chloride channel family protein